MSGERNGTPNDFVPTAASVFAKNTAATPRNPATAAPNIYKNRENLNAKESEYDGMVNAAIPVTATIIIIIGLTMFASTAA